MTHFKTLLAAVLTLLTAGACKSEYEAMLVSNDADAKYKAAFDYFNNKKYSKAASMFESMMILANGTEREDTVRYYWGLSNYRGKDYYTAETNFAKFLEIFPTSPFAEEANFLRLDCMYRATLRYELDQNPTRACMQTIRVYLKEHPTTPYAEACELMLSDLQERLDRKALEEGKLYYRQEYYKSAHVDLKNALKKNADNIYREDILYYTAMSSYKYAQLSVASKQRERFLVFVDDYLNFIGEYPESSYRRELDVLYRRSQRALGRSQGQEESGELEGTDRSFVKERRKAAREEKKK